MQPQVVLAHRHQQLGMFYHRRDYFEVWLPVQALRVEVVELAVDEPQDMAQGGCGLGLFRRSRILGPSLPLGTLACRSFTFAGLLWGVQEFEHVLRHGLSVCDHTYKVAAYFDPGPLNGVEKPQLASLPPEGTIRYRRTLLEGT